MTAADPFDLARFVAAQDRGDVYSRALAELRAGRKVGHWIWFIFPQLAGLGFSANATHYGLNSLAEAQAYLAHPVLGPRLLEAADALAGNEHLTAVAVLGEIDALKVRSSMTLFHRADPAQPIFAGVLSQFYAGEPDIRTEELLGGPNSFPRAGE